MGIVIAAQLYPACRWPRPSHWRRGARRWPLAAAAACLFAAVAVYAPLCVWAVAAEVDLAMRSPSLAWGLMVALDGAACVMLIYSLVRQTGQLLAAAPRTGLP